MAKKWEQEKIGSTTDIWKDDMDSAIKKSKMTIGYMSSDFCDHPVGRFIYPIIRSHSREINVVCINTGTYYDDYTDKIKKENIEWVEVARISDEEAARKIVENKVDVLIELGGYTSNSRLGILTYKPAKVQLSYLGYFAPTYLKSIDGWIGDTELFKGLNDCQKMHIDYIISMADTCVTMNLMLGK